MNFFCVERSDQFFVFLRWPKRWGGAESREAVAFGRVMGWAERAGGSGAPCWAMERGPNGRSSRVGLPFGWIRASAAFHPSFAIRRSDLTPPSGSLRCTPTRTEIHGALLVQLHLGASDRDHTCVRPGPPSLIKGFC
jgi:hypothetical protein